MIPYFNPRQRTGLGARWVVRPSSQRTLMGRPCRTRRRVARRYLTNVAIIRHRERTSRRGRRRGTGRTDLGEIRLLVSPSPVAVRRAGPGRAGRRSRRAPGAVSDDYQSIASLRRRRRHLGRRRRCRSRPVCTKSIKYSCSQRNPGLVHPRVLPPRRAGVH